MKSFRTALIGVYAAAVLASLGSLSGCASSAAEMTPQQKEAYEQRRYCESNPNDVASCVGFLGFI